MRESPVAVGIGSEAFEFAPQLDVVVGHDAVVFVTDEVSDPSRGSGEDRNPVGMGLENRARRILVLRRGHQDIDVIEEFRRVDPAEEGGAVADASGVSEAFKPLTVGAIASDDEAQFGVHGDCVHHGVDALLAAQTCE